MDLTASERTLRCYRIRDPIVAVTADDVGLVSYLFKPATSTARLDKPRTHLHHCESHRGPRGEVIVT